MNVYNKSEEYLEGAQTLINANKNLHCCVVFSYFYVFEYLKFLLANRKRNPVPYANQGYPGEDSHKKIREEVIKNISSREATDLYKEIENLHDERVLAEYRTKTYSQEEALDILDIAKRLQKKLKYYYNNQLP